MAEKISLYIPCYNAREYITDCLDGVLRQTYPIDEIFVVDDGPGYGVGKLVTDYPVKVISRKGRLGLPSARNLIFQEARNNLVAAIDVDCVAEPQWLANLIKNITEDNIAGVGGKAIEKFGITLADRWRQEHMKQHWGDARQINPSFLYGCNALYRRDSIIHVGLFSDRYRRGYEDVDISRRLKEAGYMLIYEPSAVVYHMRKDNIRSLLMTHWNWSFSGTGGMRVPDNFYGICCKSYDNIFRMISFIKEDTKCKRFAFLFIDISLFFHHLALDLQHYIRNLSKHRIRT